MSKRILVCDDDRLLTDLLTFRLTARGFTVDVAHDGREALERVEQARPDAIILDAMMPVVEGREVLRQLRTGPASQWIPVIMLTARRHQRDIVSALEIGADDYVVKPFIPEELIMRVTRLIGEESHA